MRSRGPAGRAPKASRPLALAADGLTLARLVIAVSLAPVLGTGRIVPASLLLGSAWIADFLDGRAARASAVPTSLGRFDLIVDTAVGAGAVLGSTALGWVPTWLGVGLVLVLGAAFLVTANEAMSMLLQATGYGLVLWRTVTDREPVAFGWLVAVIATIGFTNRRIFWERSLPTFLNGIAQVLRPRRPS